MCNHNICKALITFLKCTLCPYNGAQPFNKVPGGDKERHFQGSLTVEVVMARALTTNMLKSYHLNTSKALEHPAPGLFTAGYHWGAGGGVACAATIA